jgi:hypothetical protein
MKTKASATAMSMEWLRERGYIVERTEQNVRVPDKKIPGGWRIWKKDLFSFADLTGVDGKTPGTLFTQATIGMNNKAERMEKIAQAPATRAVLASGNQIELHVWRKMGARGARKTWEMARFTIHIDGSYFTWRDENGERAITGPLFEPKETTAVEGDF